MLHSGHLDKSLAAVEQWGRFELAVSAPEQKDPFCDEIWSATFEKDSQSITVKGFYDGDGIYRLRFMPEEVGFWSYVTTSSVPELHDVSGTFECRTPASDNHGYVKVKNARQFCYADGTIYHPFGTTCYAWIHQPEEVRRRTLDSLVKSPFQ